MYVVNKGHERERDNERERAVSLGMRDGGLQPCIRLCDDSCSLIVLMERGGSASVADRGGNAHATAPDGGSLRTMRTGMS